MKKILLVCVLALLGYGTSALADNLPTVTKQSETATTVTYKIEDADGISEVIVTYQVLAAGDIYRYPCPKSLTLTIKKQQTSPAGTYNFNQLSVQDCAARQEGVSQNNLRIFTRPGDGGFDIADIGADFYVTPQPPPPFPPFWKDPTFWFLIFILLLLWLLWWLAWGPFRR